MTFTHSAYEQLTVGHLKSLSGLPLLLELESSVPNALSWAEERAQDIQCLLRDNGAVLIRGLKIPSTTLFSRVLTTLFGAPLIAYPYRSTPRTALRGNVYTATEYPATEMIPQHNENSYQRHWPNRIGFFCVLPAERGGETPIADSRLVHKMLPETIRRKFEALGVKYVRNYSTLDLPWSVVFQTEDKDEVERYCRANALDYEWLPDDRLRTSQINPAVAIPPGRIEKVWFNQAHLFHATSVGAQIARTLAEALGEEHLPRNSYYGDGTAIEPEVLDVIRSTYDQATIKFAWAPQDLLLLDNMLFSHGRCPFSGPRNVLVGMACPNH